MKIAKLIFIFISSLVFLTACGGSAEPLSRDEGTSTPVITDGLTPPAISITMSILDQQGNVNTQLSEGAPLNVNARVIDDAGNPVVGEIVSYLLSQNELAVFSNDTATGLTNSEGIATIQMTVGTLSGSGSITASIENATGAENSASATSGFLSLGAPQATPQNLTLDLSMTDTLGNPQTQLTNAGPLSVNARVLDSSGNPVAGLLISYLLSQDELAMFNNGTATGLTNVDGVASILMSVGTISGSGTVTVNVDNIDAEVIGFTSIDTVETITQSLSLELFLQDALGAQQTDLIEGSPLNVTARVLDSAGEPVAGLLVSYAVNQVDLAVFNNSTGTSLTNADGIASIQMMVGTLSGSGTVTASIEGVNSVLKGFTSLGPVQTIPSSIELYANAVQLASSGGDEIELIAVMKNEQNILLPGIAVSFSVDENGSLSKIDPETGPDGTARAILTTQNNKQNRVLNVVASSAGLVQELKINVVGTEVNVNGATSVIIDDDSPITIVLSDSDGAGIANEVVNLSASLGSFDDAAPVTGADGQVTVNFKANAAGNSEIIANALSASTSFEIAVQQDDFSFIDIPTKPLELNETVPDTLSLRWFKNGSPYANGRVMVTTSRGNIVGNNTTLTGPNGIATVSIESKYAGLASVSAVGVDADDNEVTARLSIEFIATNVDSIFVDATPDLIAPEGQTTTITARVRDEEGNLVKGKAVNFRLDIDASGGSISPNTAITDSNGIASSVYTSNSISGDQGVTVSAQSDGVIGTTQLTVGDRAFDISLGTGSSIQLPDNTTYLKEFAVFVTDASGRPIANAELTSTVTPTAAQAFRKGTWVWNEENSIYVERFANLLVTSDMRYCPNEDFDKDGILDDFTKVSEDTNKNGVLDPDIFVDFNGQLTLVSAAEDLNQNGVIDFITEDTNNNGILDTTPVLEDLNGNGIIDDIMLSEDRNGDGFLSPGNVASISFKDNISRTNEFGQATLELRYPKQFGNWAKVLISVFGQSAGSESMQTQVFALTVAADDLKTEGIPPPSSPFGVKVGFCNTFE